MDVKSFHEAAKIIETQGFKSFATVSQLVGTETALRFLSCI